MNQPSKEGAAKHESAKKPGKDDLHEQREHDQPQEGAVREATPKVPLPQTKQNGVDSNDGAGVRFVPSDEPAKVEPTPEAAREQKAHH